jgi:TetR/AcrR family transcriptional regulator
MPQQPSGREESPARDRIVDAARICFMRDGVRRTTMSHVAEEAGVVRQTLYDWVGSKEELVDLAMVRRTRELGELIRARGVDDGLTAGEQIVDLLTAMVQLAGSDPEFELLAQAMPEGHAFAFLAGPSELTDMVEGLLTPFFDRARAEGRLREDRGTRALAAWTQSVLAPLRNRADLSPTEIEETLRYFLLPALLRD